MSGNKTTVSVDEIISTLKHSNWPTIIVEGTDDVIVYRHLERCLSEFSVSVLPVSGRDAVLAIFDRVDEIPNKNSIVFVADQDVWVFKGVPAEYNSEKIILTSGCSVENDVLLDGNAEDYLYDDEKIRFFEELNVFLDWYSLALSRHLIDESHPITLHANHILNDAVERSRLMILKEGENYPSELRDKLGKEYKTMLRGKSLVGVLFRQLGRGGRSPQHNIGSFMDHVARNRGPLLESLYSRVASSINKQKAA